MRVSRQNFLFPGFFPDLQHMQNFVILNLGFARTRHRWQGHDISSPFLRLFCVQQGRAVLHFRDRDVETLPGHLYLIPAYEPHSYDCEAGFAFYYLFVFLLPQERTSLFDRYELPIEVSANHAARLLFQNYCMLYPQLNLPSRSADEFLNHRAYRDYVQAFMVMPHFERMQLRGLAEILLSYFVKHGRERAQLYDSRIAPILEYIQQHLHVPISVEQLADMACLTKSYFIRRFRQVVGITPIQYVQKRKVQHAQKLLLESEKNIGQIAAEVGFADTAYFIRIFKSHIGYTPQEYRVRLIG